MSAERDEYLSISRGFSELTAVRHPDSGLCCAEHWRGIPRCCETVVHNKSTMVFSRKEIDLLCEGRKTWQRDHFSIDFPLEGCGAILHGQFWFLTPNSHPGMVESLHTGMLSEVIESTSHPTRPVVHLDMQTDSWVVTEVVTVRDCIAGWNLQHLTDHRAEFEALWQRAVDLLGPKPYYVRRPDERLLTLS